MDPIRPDASPPLQLELPPVFAAALYGALALYALHLFLLWWYERAALQRSRARDRQGDDIARSFGELADKMLSDEQDASPEHFDPLLCPVQDEEGRPCRLQLHGHAIPHRFEGPTAAERKVALEAGWEAGRRARLREQIAVVPAPQRFHFCVCRHEQGSHALENGRRAGPCLLPLCACERFAPEPPEPRGQGGFGEVP